MVSARSDSSDLQPLLPPQPPQPWWALTKQGERVVELTQEDDDGEVDGLDGDQGKPWHLSTSPCTHAHHIFHHLRTQGRMGHPPKVLFCFQVELDHTHSWSQVFAGQFVHKLNSCDDLRRCLFSSLIIYSDVFMGSAYLS